MDGKNYLIAARVWLLPNVWKTQSLTLNGDINVMFLAKISPVASWSAGANEGNFNIERAIPFIKFLCFLPQIRLQVCRLALNAIIYCKMIQTLVQFLSGF